MVSEHRQKERISDGAMAWGQIERVKILRNRSHCLRQNSWTVTRSANRSTRRLPPVEMRRIGLAPLGSARGLHLDRRQASCRAGRATRDSPTVLTQTEVG